MNRHRPELADVVREHAASYEQTHKASVEQRRVLRAVMRCRTRELGGHKWRYSCGHERIAYNSCRNRHCPKCQAAARAQWLEARRRELLEVAYFHVVLTLPTELGALALYNRKLVYSLLFRAGAESLLAAARDTRLLGAEIGILAVLHTWGQNLHHHPHLHCLIPAGGLSPDGQRWVTCPNNFFLPVRLLGRLLRGKLLAYLEDAFRRDELVLPGVLQQLASDDGRRRWLDGLRRCEWVVYAKPPFGGPETVLKYLARYTHRVAISNSRLIALQDGVVSFIWKDYAQGGYKRTMRLAAVEFIRRFLLHVLPQGFMRVRYFGFLANRHRQRKLALIRQLLEQRPRPSDHPTPHVSSAPRDDGERCPRCQRGHLVGVEVISAVADPAASVPIHDSS